MPDRLPKLLIVEGLPVIPREVADALAGVYQTRGTSLADTKRFLERHQCDAVMIDPTHLVGLGHDLEESLTATLLESIGAGACLVSQEGEALWSNGRFREFEEVTQRKVLRMCVRAISAFQTAAARSDPRAPRAKRRVFRGGGAGRSLEAVISPVFSSKGVDRAAAIVRDVSIRERMQRKIDAIDLAGRELVNIQEESVRDMHVTQRLALLEQKVVTFAHDLLSFDHFAIRLLNRKTNELEIVMSHGLPEEAKAIILKAEPEGNGISGLVASTGASYICPVVQEDPRYVTGLERAGSSLTVPLKMFDRVIGVFNVESDREHAFTAADRQFLEIFARYLAIALHFLNLLVVERSATREVATGTVEGELREPLNDLMVEVEWLREQAGANPEALKHIQRITGDVDSIRRRMKNIARGPQTLLGIEEALQRSEVDPALKGKHVVVSDNEPEISGIIRDVLSKRGADVTTFDTGAAAISALATIAPPPDLVISDINLGDRTGYEVFAAAKDRAKQTPVILMTGFGYDPHHSIVRASQEGLQNVLFKPFQVEKLIEEVKRALGETAG
ncbi:MAG: response regulator [Phycisphaerales bacterium]